jgi:hypothetical protein
VIIFVNITNQLLLVTVAQCVFCAVENKVLNIISINDSCLYQKKEFKLYGNL